MDNLNYLDLTSELFQALANPRRLRILKALEHGPKNVKDIAKTACISEATASALLKQLNHTGLLIRHQHGRNRYYSLFNPRLLDWINSAGGFVAPAITGRYIPSQVA